MLQRSLKPFNHNVVGACFGGGSSLQLGIVHCQLDGWTGGCQQFGSSQTINQPERSKATKRRSQMKPGNSGFHVDQLCELLFVHRESWKV
jgi:hypothetical protein